jgi:hypothetical protein
MKNYLPVFVLLLALAACKKNDHSTPHTLYRYDYRDTLAGTYAGKLLQEDYEWRGTEYVLYKKTIIADTMRITKPHPERVQVEMLKAGQFVGCVFPRSALVEMPIPTLSYEGPQAAFSFSFTIKKNDSQVLVNGWRIDGTKKTTWTSFESDHRRYIKGEWQFLP